MFVELRLGPRWYIIIVCHLDRSISHQAIDPHPFIFHNSIKAMPRTQNMVALPPELWIMIFDMVIEEGIVRL